MKTSSASKILEKDLKMKSRFAFLVLMVFAMLIVLCSAGMAETNGTIGDLTWVLNDSGTLTISGTGVVASGFSELDGKENVKRIVMEEGITGITNLAFSDYKNVEEISVPNSVVSIGNNIVYGCSKLTGIVLSDNITSIEKRAFSWTSAKLYAKINSTTAKTLGKSDYAFRTQGGNYDLRYIYSDEQEIGLSLEKVDADTNSVVIPDGVTMIGSNPFSYRKNIVNVSVPGSVRSISSKAFSSMEYSIVFLGNAPDMAEDAFDKAMILAHYPKDGEGWAEVIQKQFGASWIQWVNGEEGTTPDTERDTTEELEPEETNNEEAQNYFTWSHPVRSNLIKQNDGTWLRVEQANNVVVVEEYTQDLTISWRKTFQMELPLWGGYFHGAQYHYLVFGQGNPDEDNEKEIMRIVRYTANWKRIDAASVKGANTTVPFDAGSLRMTESENYLFVHTNHTMYKSSDGLNHQSNMSYKIYIPTMSVIRRSVQEANQGDYVSHSFNQFVIRDENNIIKVDHGDAYPRSVLLQIFEDATETLGSGSRKSVNVLKITGKTGNNYTGVSVGGLESSATHYLIAGNSVDQAKFDTDTQRNIFIATVPKDQPSDETVHFRWITSHTGEMPYVSTPHLVKIPGSNYLLMWTESESEYNYGASSYVLKYLFLNGNGDSTSEIYSAETSLSDCKPVVSDNKITWYVTRDSAAFFYEIDLNNPSKVTTLQYHGWLDTEAGKQYYGKKGNIVTGFRTIKGDTYYFSEDGIMQVGFLTIEDGLYYFREDGRMAIGWIKLNDMLYHFEEDGKADIGWKDFVGTGEYDWDIKMRYPEGAYRVFFDTDGHLLTGLQVIGDNIYYLTFGGLEKSKWIDNEKSRYYFDENGVAVIGWRTIPVTRDQYNYETEQWNTVTVDGLFYFDQEGHMLSGLQTIDGKTYHLTNQGATVSNWFTDKKVIYYFDENGVAATGWRTIPVTRNRYNAETERWDPVTVDGLFCFDQEGHMLSGLQTIDGKTYHLSDEGATVSDWLSDETGRYYFDENGAAVTGWRTFPVTLTRYNDETDQWYDVTVNGIFYFDQEGHMLSGLQTIDGKTYRLTDQGATVNDWFTVEKNKYYFDENGVAVTGLKTIPVTLNQYDYEKEQWLDVTVERIFCFDQDGHMLSGLQTIDGKTYRMTDQGATVNDWFTDGNDRYYFGSKGAALTGWQKIDVDEETQTYYFDASGKMYTGWLEADGKHYYFAPGTGELYTGQHTIDGVEYNFNDDGVLTGDEPPIEEATEALIENSIYRINEKGTSAVFADSEKKNAKTLVVKDTVVINGREYQVSEIAEGACRDMTKLKKVTLGKYVQTIGKNAFENCSSLEEVTGSETVSSMGESAFKNCGSLKEFTLGKKLKTIAPGVFSGCASLRKITGGTSVTSIGKNAFSDCGKLTSFPKLDKLQTIGDAAFGKCVSLKEFFLGKKVSKIGKNAFLGCKALKKIVLKTLKLSGKNVGKDAFKGSANKMTVFLPKSKMKEYKKILSGKGVSKKAVYKSN